VFWFILKHSVHRDSDEQKTTHNYVMTDNAHQYKANATQQNTQKSHFLT